MSLLFITSPAKTLDETPDWQQKTIKPTLPRNIETTEQIVSFLKKQSATQLQKTLSVSEKIAKLNYDRFQQWNTDHTTKNSKPALLLYDGDIYKEIDKKAFTKKQQTYAQNHLRIISGLYGLLRPYDRIQPYRLEMKTKLSLTGALSSYWSDEITTLLEQDAKEIQAQAIVNLASKEYVNAVTTKKLTIPFVTVAFKEERKGKLVTIAIYAKKARGAMIDYCVKHAVTTLEELTKATINGYQYKQRDGNTLLFVR